VLKLVSVAELTTVFDDDLRPVEPGSGVIGRLATADDRSMNNWIIHMVSQHLKALEAGNGDESR